MLGITQTQDQIKVSLQSPRQGWLIITTGRINLTYFIKSNLAIDILLKPLHINELHKLFLNLVLDPIHHLRYSPCMNLHHQLVQCKGPDFDLLHSIMVPGLHCYLQWNSYPLPVQGVHGAHASGLLKPPFESNNSSLHTRSHVGLCLP